MPEPTGNRWRDPDTGKIANPGNIQLDTYEGKDAAAQKYGPALRNSPDDEVDKAAVAIAAAHVGADAAKEQLGADDLPEVKSKLGPSFDEKDELKDPAPPTLPPADAPAYETGYEELRGQIRDLGGKAKQGDAAATSELNKIAESEYNREDGGRTPIKKMLAAYSIGRPKV